MADSASGRYKYLQKIGEGVHGIVLKAQDLTTGNDVAIKKVSLRTKHGEISLSTVREIKALQHCDCKYVSISYRLEAQSIFRFACKTQINANSIDYVIVRCIPWYDWIVIGVWIYAAHIVLRIAKWIAATKPVDHSIVHEHVIVRRQLYA